MPRKAGVTVAACLVCTLVISGIYTFSNAGQSSPKRTVAMNMQRLDMDTRLPELTQSFQPSTHTKIAGVVPLLITGVLYAYDKDEMIAPGTYGDLSIQLTQKWARRHGYQVFVEKVVGVKDRAPQWVKIAAILAVLPKVDFLITMDFDAYIIDMERTAVELFPRSSSACASSTPSPHNTHLAVQEDEIFLWGGQCCVDHFDSGTKSLLSFYKFEINFSDGMMGIVSNPKSISFFKTVWEQGTEGSGYGYGYRFPHEMGAIQNVLLQSKFNLNRACILSEDKFQRVTLESPQRIEHLMDLVERPFAVHASGPMQNELKSKRRLEIAKVVWKRHLA